MRKMKDSILDILTELTDKIIIYLVNSSFYWILFWSLIYSSFPKPDI